jgi:hypothetical protein
LPTGWLILQKKCPDRDSIRGKKRIIVHSNFNPKNHSTFPIDPFKISNQPSAPPDKQANIARCNLRASSRAASA